MRQRLWRSACAHAAHRSFLRVCQRLPASPAPPASALQAAGARRQRVSLPGAWRRRQRRGRGLWPWPPGAGTQWEGECSNWGRRRAAAETGKAAVGAGVGRERAGIATRSVPHGVSRGVGYCATLRASCMPAAARRLPGAPPPLAVPQSSLACCSPPLPAARRPLQVLRPVNPWLPPGMYAQSLARFAANLQGRAREMVLQRARASTGAPGEAVAGWGMSCLGQGAGWRTATAGLPAPACALI